MTTSKTTSTRIVRFPQIAQPTIEEVFSRFLEDQARRLKPRTMDRYGDVIDLLRHSLDGYAHQTLDPKESALFQRYFDATGPDHREFCQIFGPDKIAENIGGFLGWFLIRKVIAGEDLLRAAGTVTKKLSRWMEQQGMIEPAVADEVVEAGAGAVRDLPRAERAARLLADHAAAAGRDPQDFADADYLEFEHFDIVKLEPGRVWLAASLGGEKYGPISIPGQGSRLLRQGWEIGCALGRVRGRWHIVEMGNVYPH